MNTTLVEVRYPSLVKPTGEEVQLVASFPPGAGDHSVSIFERLQAIFSDGLDIENNNGTPKITRTTHANSGSEARRHAEAFADVLGDLLPYTPVLVPVPN